MLRATPRARLVLLIGAFLAGLVGFLASATRLIILPSFAAIEEAAVAANTRRVLSHIAGELGQLSSLAGDYAGWDDTYRFIRDGNREYIESNLIDATFERLNLNIALFVDESGRLVYGKGFHPSRKTAIPLPDGLMAHLAGESPLLHHAGPESAVTGILGLAQGPLLLASRPILTSDYQGPLRGSLVMGRFLDAAAVERLARATLLPVSVARIGDPGLPAGIFPGEDLGNAGAGGVRVLAGSEETVTGYGLLRDIYGKPALVVSVALPRDIHLQGMRSIRLFVFLFASVGLVVGILAYVLLGRLMLLGRQREALLERYRAVVTGAAEGIVLVDSGSLVILEANRAFEQMLGRGAGELDGMPFTLLATDGSPAVAGLFPHSSRAAGRRRHGLRLRRRDGSIAETEISVSPLDLNGKESWSLLIDDVTERRRAEGAIRTLNADLRTASRELEAFAYSVSHDLRAPLRAIEGFSGIVEDEYGAQLGDEGRRLLGVVRANTMNMSLLIDDLLAFSRSNRGEITRTRLDMAGLVRSVFSAVVEDPEERSRIDFSVGDLPETEGDATLLRQVWVNLLSNAVKFSRQRARAAIEVTGAVAGDEAVYHVRDNGVGFDMRYVSKLYGVFQRLHPVESFAGTGIGLALVKRIVTRHGGRVWAEAELDEGATFSFSLPRKPSPAAGAAGAPGRGIEPVL